MSVLELAIKHAEDDMPYIDLTNVQKIEVTQSNQEDLGTELEEQSSPTRIDDNNDDMKSDRRTESSSSGEQSLSHQAQSSSNIKAVEFPTPVSPEPIEINSSLNMNIATSSPSSDITSQNSSPIPTAAVVADVKSTAEAEQHKPEVLSSHSSEEDQLAEKRMIEEQRKLQQAKQMLQEGNFFYDRVGRKHETRIWIWI